ncbi:class D beta-lactamase [Microvirga lenta]|uniref:class D beta-lactamase n=1 Tax=Microvirga lenta TaxID=2881337 RepID=UPI00384A7002
MRTMRAALVLGLLVLSGPALARTCTLIADAETGRLLQRIGECGMRVSPASTFKIALAVMGYDSGYLKGPHDPALPYRQEYAAPMEGWRKTTDPTAWMRDSVVWYSQELTRALGQERFANYVERLAYGNRNVTGDPGRDNGLTHAWLSSSLRISPLEQVVFLRKLLRHELPVSPQAMDAAAALLPTFAADDGWTVHGKTGTGLRMTVSGKRDRNRQFGWFVGWASRGEDRFIFARLVTDHPRGKGPAGFHARDTLVDELPELLDGY